MTAIKATHEAPGKAPGQGGQEGSDKAEQEAGQGQALLASLANHASDDREADGDEVANAFSPAAFPPGRRTASPDPSFQDPDEASIIYQVDVQALFNKIGVSATPEIVTRLRRLGTPIREVEHAVSIAAAKGIHDERYVYKILASRREHEKIRRDFTRPAYANERWLDSEELRLRDEVQRHWPLDEIARLHRRTESAIQNRVIRLYGDGTPEARKYGLPTEPPPKHQARRCSVNLCNDIVQDGKPMCIAHFTDSLGKHPAPVISPAPTLAQIRAALVASA